MAMVVEGGEMACMCCRVRDGGFDDWAGRGRRPFTGPESFRPE